MPGPEVAVVIPCFDLGRTLEEALDSVLAQTRPATEIVVVDDGSTDRQTRELLARLERPRTRIVTIPHGGVAVARNHGVSLTRAPYLLLLDADDRLDPRYLERLTAALDADPNLAFVSCAVQAFEGADYVWTPPSLTAVGSLARGSVHVSTLFRRTLWDAVGGFDPELPAYEDLDFWVRAIRLGFRGEVIDEPLLQYRVRADSRYRRGIESGIYRRALSAILAKNRDLLERQGIELLIEKEEFLTQLVGHQEHLQERAATVRSEIARLDREIADARSGLAERASPDPGPSSSRTSSGRGEPIDRRVASDRAWSENARLSREELRAGKTTLTARPQFLIVDPTSRCNARCVMCPVSFRPPGDHGTDLERSVFAKCAELFPAASHLNLFASGEPTIAPEIVAELKASREGVSRRAQVWISTNGKRLTREIVECLDAPNLGLQFSVDGGTAEVFEAIRRGIRFNELRSSLELVRQHRRKSPYPALSFSSTISKRNLHDLAHIFELAREFGVEQVIFYEEDPEVPSEEPYLLDESDRPIFEAQLPRIEATGVAYSNGLYFRGARGLRAIEPPPPENPPPLFCKAPWKVFHVRAEGTVRTCCTLRRSMGDLSHQSVEEVWNGEQYVGLRRAFVEQSGIPGTCYRCTDPLRTWGE
jgi:glycosyltransferase involved in cell wall biosynthesis/MoaA/NifB/PqqE/SkfB family radical SAM enzyme